MGLFGKLFGGSDEPRRGEGDRCNECGMAGGGHTEWCPTAEEAEVTPRSSDATQRPRPASGADGNEVEDGRPTST